MNKKSYTPARRYLAYISTIGTTQLHLRSPLMMALWSAMFPGFGHLLLSKYLRGSLLFILEVVVNTGAHINRAILYSFTGQFDIAKKVLDTRWILLYVPIFLFAIWDSYRTTVDLNNQYILALRENADIKPFKLDAIEINYLDKKSPWSSVIWSFMLPGAGQLSIHRLVSAFFILIWWISIVYYSNFLPAIHYTLVGDFELARSALNPQWTLNLPSIYFFTAYDAYVNTVESNKLFDWEQSKFLKRNYENKLFQMPFINISGSDHTYIISTFEQSLSLEKAITAVQIKGIAKENILAVSMDKKSEQPNLFDKIYSSDGLNLLDLSFLLGSVFSLFGVIYGFILTWGPIIWGLIGILAGFAVGFSTKLLFVKKYIKNSTNKIPSQVVLVIKCDEDKLDIVKDILWEHNAMGVRRLELN